MKSIIRIAGLCLVAMFAMSIVVVGTASAEEPHWLHCVNVGASKGTYEDNQCSKPGGKKEWEWVKVEGTEKVISHGSLILTDTKVPVEGDVTVSCTGKDAGWVGPGKFDQITAITEIKCKAGKGCEEITKEPEPRDLPWQTELVEEAAGKIRDEIRVGSKGGEPGWAVGCKVLGMSKTDECTSDEGSTAVVNKASTGSGGNDELLVLADFEEKTPKANCTVGGAKSGEVLGTIALLQENGQGLEVSG